MNFCELSFICCCAFYAEYFYTVDLVVARALCNLCISFPVENIFSDLILITLLHCPKLHMFKAE